MATPLFLLMALVYAVNPFHPAYASRICSTSMALASWPARQGQQRSLRRILQVLSSAFARPPGARSLAWALLASFCDSGFVPSPVRDLRVRGSLIALIGQGDQAGGLQAPGSRLAGISAGRGWQAVDKDGKPGLWPQEQVHDAGVLVDGRWRGGR